MGCRKPASIAAAFGLNSPAITRACKAGALARRRRSACDAEFYGEVSTWLWAYTGGEDWHETCPSCRRQFWVSLRFKRRKRLPVGDELPRDAVAGGRATAEKDTTAARAR